MSEATPSLPPTYEHIFGLDSEKHKQLSFSSTQLSREFFLAQIKHRDYSSNPTFSIEASRFQSGESLSIAPTKRVIDVVTKVAEETLPLSGVLDSAKMTFLPQRSEENIKNLTQIQEDLNSLDEGSMVEPERRTLMIGEILAKGLAYSRITGHEEEPLSLDIPQLIDGKWQKITYSTLAWDLGDNNIAYILEPPKTSKAPPIVIIRGTKPSFTKGTLQTSLGMQSVMNFLKDESLAFGEAVLVKNQLKFTQLLSALNSEYSTKPVVVGHSLGGTLAQRFALQLDNIDKISLIMAFNSPGITHAELKKWERHVESHPGDRSKAVVVNTSDDFVNPLARRRFIGRKFIFTPKEKFKKVHGKALLGRAGKIDEVTVEKTLSSLKTTSEKVARITKNIFKFIAYRMVFRILTTLLLCLKAVIVEIIFKTSSSNKYDEFRIARQKEIESDPNLTFLDKIRAQSQEALISHDEIKERLNILDEAFKPVSSLGG